MAATSVVTMKVPYNSGDLQLTGYKAFKASAEDKRAAVIVAHTAIGPHDLFIQEAIQKIAELGYIAFALDMYGAPDIMIGAAKEEANAPYKENRHLIAERASAAVQVVQNMEDVDSARIGAIGFCFGGTVVLDLARTGADLCAVVSYHGVLDRLGVTGETVKPKVLVYHGYADPYTSPQNLSEFIGELEEVGARYEVRVCGNQVLHGFMRPEKTTPEDARMGHQYNEDIASQAWAATFDLLHTCLKKL